VALYGSVDAIKGLLRADVGSAFNADQEARIVALRKWASAYIEQETGRVFGVAAASETVAVETPGNDWLLLLPKAARTVTAVTLSPEWTGSGWTNGTPLAADEWRFAMVQRTGEALALRRVHGWHWPSLVVVTGTWEDADADLAVPDEIVYVANFLAAERFKLEQASPAGQIGPDGSVLPVRNVLKDPLVTAALARWTAARQAVVL
jgi:hypothetical protein